MKWKARTAVMAIAVAYALLVISNVASREAYEDADHHLWLHQMKKTYCASIRSYRIYKNED